MKIFNKVGSTLGYVVAFIIAFAVLFFVFKSGVMAKTLGDLGFDIVRQDTPKKVFERAESAFYAEEYKEAIDEYRDFLEKYPDHELEPTVLLKIGNSFEMLGDKCTFAEDAYNRLLQDYDIDLDPSQKALIKGYSSRCRQGKTEKVACCTGLETNAYCVWMLGDKCDLTAGCEVGCTT